MTTKSRCYSELITIQSFTERYRYLKLNGVVGKETFGYDRYLNQALYASPIWRALRRKIIIRDEGCDLGVPGYEIEDRIIVHHMNPITIEDIELERSVVFNPEFLICVSPNTHRAIHYGDESQLPQIPVERTPWDTCPWRKKSKWKENSSV